MADPIDRLASSGLAFGAESLSATLAGTVQNVVSTGQTDWRVKITVSDEVARRFGIDNKAPNRLSPVMSPLASTKGVIFPYTPTITVNHTARWNASVLTHSNYSSYFYEGSEVQAINIASEFTVQNSKEGQYVMAAITFFRACTKMFYGPDEAAGTPPPIVYLDGYGAGYFPHVPCVITQFTHTMPAEVDYLEISAASVGNNYGIPTRVPIISTFNLSLQPVYSRNSVARNGGIYNIVSGQSAVDRNGFI